MAQFDFGTVDLSRGVDAFMQQRQRVKQDQLQQQQVERQARQDQLSEMLGRSQMDLRDAQISKLESEAALQPQKTKQLQDKIAQESLARKTKARGDIFAGNTPDAVTNRAIDFEKAFGRDENIWNEVADHLQNFDVNRMKNMGLPGMRFGSQVENILQSNPGMNPSKAISLAEAAQSEANKPVTNINTVVQKEFNKKLGAGAADSINTAIDSLDKVQKRITSFDTMKDQMDKGDLYVGFWGPLKAVTAKIFQGTTGVSPAVADRIARTEVFESLSNALTILEQKDLKGSTSDRDLNRVAKINAGIAQSRLGSQQLIRIAMEDNLYERDAILALKEARNTNTKQYLTPQTLGFTADTPLGAAKDRVLEDAARIYDMRSSLSKVSRDTKNRVKVVKGKNSKGDDVTYRIPLRLSQFIAGRKADFKKDFGIRFESAPLNNRNKAMLQYLNEWKKYHD